METSGFSLSGKIGPELGRMTCATATRSTALPPIGASANSTASSRLSRTR